MASVPFIIDNIFGGLSQARNFGQKGGYHAAIGIDPDMPSDDSGVHPSGYIRPTSMEKFTSTTLTAPALWLVTNPKDSNTYAYDTSGKVYTIDSSLTISALNSGSALTDASANGADYYDNYIYLPKQTDICRYGPLDGSPSFTQSYWVGSLAKTALSNTTYPTINGISMPNHVTHRHTDDKLYVADVVSGHGSLHYVKTTKTTVEGDTNSGSSYQALDFDQGYYPSSIETYETQLVVALFEGTNTTIKQKPAALTFWDTTSSSFQKLIQIEFPDPLITALKNVNGVLYVFSGSAQGGNRVTRFIGGYSYEEVYYNPDEYPVLPGAVDAELNRVVWGSKTTYPEAVASVFARGSRFASLGNGTHNILKSTAGTNGVITAVKYVQQSGVAYKQPIVAWKDDSGSGIDKRSTTYGTSVWRSEVFRVGRPGQIKRLTIPLAQELGSNMTLTVKIYTDDGSSSTTVATSTDSRFQGKRCINVQPTANFQHNFFIELRWTGSALVTAALPITGIIETKEYE